MPRLIHVLISCVVILAILLAGCAPAAGPQGSTVAPAATSTMPASAATSPPPAVATLPAETPTTPAAIEQARQALAGHLGADPRQIQLDAFRSTEWADACLGIPDRDEQCAQALTSGYRGIFLAQGSRYAFHSDLEGANVRILPAAALAAQEALAYQLGVQPVEVAVTEVARVDWPDGCLEIYQPDRVCTAMVVPGYRVRLEAGGQGYEYHTDESGSMALRVDVAPGELGPVLVSWSNVRQGGCDSAQISATRVAYGPCDGGLTTVDISPARGQGARYLAGKFAPFEADSAAGTVSFSGSGPVTATPSQQRAVIEWALLVYQEASAGRSGIDWGLAFRWQREGGIAGFCDAVAVYLSGEASVASCQQPQGNHFWLNNSQMRMVFTWVDTLRSFELEQADPATADAMTRRITFSGTGSGSAGEYEIMSIYSLAEELAARNLLEGDKLDAGQTVLALEGYLGALAAGNYAGAATLYGGSYEVLTDNNPEIEPNDHAALFEAGCKLNGFVCTLSILHIVDTAQLSAADMRVSVELKNPDGSLFVLGPCCGASEQDMPSLTQFDFLVSKMDGQYRVIDLPLYIP